MKTTKLFVRPKHSLSPSPARTPPLLCDFEHGIEFEMTIRTPYSSTNNRPFQDLVEIKLSYINKEKNLGSKYRVQEGTLVSNLESHSQTHGIERDGKEAWWSEMKRQMKY